MIFRGKIPLKPMLPLNIDRKIYCASQARLWTLMPQRISVHSGRSAFKIIPRSWRATETNIYFKKRLKKAKHFPPEKLSRNIFQYKWTLQRREDIFHWQSFLHCLKGFLRHFHAINAEALVLLVWAARISHRTFRSQNFDYSVAQFFMAETHRSRFAKSRKAIKLANALVARSEQVN